VAGCMAPSMCCGFPCGENHAVEGLVRPVCSSSNCSHSTLAQDGITLSSRSDQRTTAKSLASNPVFSATVGCQKEAGIWLSLTVL